MSTSLDKQPMTDPQMHSDSAGAAPKTKEVLCPVDGKPFTPTRSWQKWCSTDCRNKYHHSMTPAALRRDIDALRAALAELRAQIDAVNRDATRRDEALETAPA